LNETFVDLIAARSVESNVVGHNVLNSLIRVYATPIAQCVPNNNNRYLLDSY